MLLNWWGISWASTTVVGGKPVWAWRWAHSDLWPAHRWGYEMMYTYMTFMRWDHEKLDVPSVCTYCYISYISTSCLPVLSWKELLGWPSRITMVRSTKCMMPPRHLQVGLDPEAFCDYAPHRRQTWRPEVGSSSEESFGTCRMKASFLYVKRLEETSWISQLDATNFHPFPINSTGQGYCCWFRWLDDRLLSWRGDVFPNMEVAPSKNCSRL